MIKKKDMNRKIEIDITGPEGNAFCIMGHAHNFAKQLGMDKNQTDEILKDMKSGDYEHLLQVFDDHFGSYCDLIR